MVIACRFLAASLSDPIMSVHEDQHPITEHPVCGMGRRQVLGTMSLAGLGLLAGAGSAAAAPGSKGSPIVKVPTSSGSAQPIRFAESLDLPDAWEARNRSANSYYRYLSSLRLRNIDPKQVVETHARARGSVWNELPPRQLWNRMGYVLKVADRIAREMNVTDVEIVSAYRSPAYNARCRGAKRSSWHQQNIAADVKFEGVRPSRVTAMARELRGLGLFTGGVGGYWNFTHIDARGNNVDW